jgi:hypothetical protein
MAIATANPIGLIVVAGAKIYGEASGRSGLDGRGKATPTRFPSSLESDSRIGGGSSSEKDGSKMALPLRASRHCSEDMSRLLERRSDRCQTTANHERTGPITANLISNETLVSRGFCCMVINRDRPWNHS